MKPILSALLVVVCGCSNIPSSGAPKVDAAEARATGAPAREMEYLNRGVVAVNLGEGKVYVGWRYFATDDATLGFNLYREQSGKNLKLNDQPIVDSTNFVDTNVDVKPGVSYYVRPVLKGVEQHASEKFAIKSSPTTQPYLSIPLDIPKNGSTVGQEYSYRAGDASVADLDGDGEYEIILKWDPSLQHDNSQSGFTGDVILDAYKLNGKKLWRINLGPNIRAGAHYTQFMVYDLDGDGKAEVVCKTADGTIDGEGKVIGDAKADWCDDRGHILSGPEFLTVFDGMTGKALATTNYIPARHPVHPLNPSREEMIQTWGDGNANRSERYLACVAYLDGVHPSVVMCRGYYTRTVLAAWDWRGGKLTSRWVFDTSDGTPGNKEYAGQGNHNLTVTDVDGDGKDDIIYGAMCVGSDGKGKWNTTLGHGDSIHVGDFDPTNPGLESFKIQERFDDAGMHMVDVRTGKVLWRIPSEKAATSGGDKGEGPARGIAVDIDPTRPGAESWARGAGMHGMFDSKGKYISDKSPVSCNMRIYWDADELDELLDGVTVSKWDWVNEKTDVIFDARQYNCVRINGTKSNPCVSADILGDWREEIVAATNDSSELRIFTTTIPAKRRIYTLMQDPQYRMSIVWQNVAYNQPPHVGFYMGVDMKDPPRPNIRMLKRPAK